MTQALPWQVEQACHNAWLALRSAVLGDWMLRFGEGVSRRSNSVNPLHARLAGIAGQLPRFAELYRAQGLPLIVRVPHLIGQFGAIESELDRHGFSTEGETCTLYRDFGTTRFDTGPDETISPRADAEWLTAIARLQRQIPTHAATYARVVDMIALPAGFVGLCRDGAIAAVAYGVLHDRLLVCESVVVDEQLRGQGLGRRMMQGLFAWAVANGATAACLQVAADNVAGRALYASLGLATELYRYHYRRAA